MKDNKQEAKVGYIEMSKNYIIRIDSTIREVYTSNYSDIFAIYIRRDGSLPGQYSYANKELRDAKYNEILEILKSLNK